MGLITIGPFQLTPQQGFALNLYSRSMRFQKVLLTSYLFSKPISAPSYQCSHTSLKRFRERFVDPAHSWFAFAPTSPSRQNPLLAKYLQPADGELALIVSYALGDVLGRSAAAGGSEDMLHSPMDALVRYPLFLIEGYLGLPIDMDRHRADEYVPSHR
jgi:hypothetical protein